MAPGLSVEDVSNYTHINPEARVSGVLVNVNKAFILVYRMIFNKIINQNKNMDTAQ